MSYELQKLKAETASALTGLFAINSEAVRQFETGEYFIMYARGSKRLQSILGAEREILILGNIYADQQARSVQFARRIIDESAGRLESTLCVIVHQDARGNGKLKRWGRENGFGSDPCVHSNGRAAAGAGTRAVALP